MSALENPEFETQLIGLNLASNLYRVGAFSLETAVRVNNYGQIVDGILFLQNNGIIEKNKIHDVCSWIYLSEKGKKTVEETVSLMNNIINGAII